jgi:hypothetical protein
MKDKFTPASVRIETPNHKTKQQPPSPPNKNRRKRLYKQIQDNKQNPEKSSPSPSLTPLQQNLRKITYVREIKRIK